MIKQILLGVSFLLLTGCTSSSKEPIPHNRVSIDTDTPDTVTLTFAESNRFSKTDLNLGIPTLQLRNGSLLPLETDFHITVDYFDDGWQEIEVIDYFVKDYAYSLYKDDKLEYSLFTGHFENELNSGRYRFSMEYTLSDEEADETYTQKIGTVFWLNE